MLLRGVLVFYFVLFCQAAFLEDRLPLEISATVPSRLLRETNLEALEFSGRQPITVVFSRAVLSLGSSLTDSPPNSLPFHFTDATRLRGRPRWITTSIFRWDPIGRWPADLDFQLVWNTNLTTYDGVKLELGGVSRRVDIQTPVLRGTLIGVASMEALRLTDEHWDGQIGLEDDKLPEVPPDGSLVLEFSQSVSLPSLAEVAAVYALVDEQGRLRNRVEVEVRVRTCYDLNTTLLTKEGSELFADCAVLDLVGVLNQDELYGLVIPDGWDYNKERHGALRREILIEFYGLRQFRIPFLQNTFELPNSQSEVETQPSGSYVNGVNLTMWLPHGLAEDVSMADLKTAIQLQRIPWDAPGTWIQTNFELMEGNRGIVFLIAELIPAQKYRILVSGRGDIRDGFGLPLQASEVDFATSQVSTSSLFLMPYTYASRSLFRLDVDASGHWTGEISFVTRRPYGVHEFPTIKAWSILPRDEEELTALALQISIDEDFAQWRRDNEPVFQFTLPSTSEFSSSLIPMEEILAQGKGMVLMESPRSTPRAQFRFIARSLDFQVSAGFMPRKDESGEFGLDVTYLLTSTVDGEPIADVNITMMRRVDVPFRRLPSRRERNMEVVDRIQTDEDGLASFRAPDCSTFVRCTQYILYIQTTERSIFLPDSLNYRREDFGYDEGSDLVLDRRLVEPGDTLNIAGFLVSREDSPRVLPYGQNPSDEVDKELTVSPSLDPTEGPGEVDVFPVEINPDYGTFQYELEIPVDTTPGEYRVYLEQGASMTFTVGQPRIQTAVVTGTVPPWTRPDEEFEVIVEINSLLGVPIAEADFTLRWGNSSRFFEIVQLSTNSTGLASYIVDLTEAEEPIEVGETVNIEVEYIGPTREPIIRNFYVNVAALNYRLSLIQSINQAIPGLTEFGVSADLSTRDGTSLEGEEIEIQLELLELVDVENYGEAYSRENLLQRREDEGIVLSTVQECILLSSQSPAEMFASCRFVLSSLHSHVMRACISENQEAQCWTITVGRTLNDWDVDPLRFHPSPQLRLQSLEINLNGKIDCYIDLPYENVHGLFIWGNDFENQREVIRFDEKGVHEFSLQTRDECIGGCYFYGVFSSPRQTQSSTLDIPISLEFDPNLPDSFYTNYQISIRDQELPRTLNVSMRFEGEEGVPVVAPGSNTSVTISVERCRGDPNEIHPEDCQSIPARNAEVVVIGVDKAYLELEPLDLADLADGLALTQGYIGDIKSLLDNWKSSEVFDSALGILEDILRRDPWGFTNVLRNDYLSERLDVNLDELIQSQSLTINPPGLSRVLAWFGRVLQQAPDPPAMPSGRSLLEEQDPDPDLRVQTEFEVTPLFTVVKTNRRGEAKVNFTAPDNTGTFVIRAFATGRQAQHGSTEREVINRLVLTLTPSVPRFVRIGDRFEAGVIITVASEDPADSPVRVSLLGAGSNQSSILHLAQSNSTERPEGNCPEEDLSCLVVLERRSVEVDADGQIEVRFRFMGDRLGDGNITIRADYKDQSDALRLTVPVFAQQESISTATSFALSSEEDVAFEGLKIPNAVSGSGTLELFAGVGRFPAVLEMATKIMETWQEDPVAIHALANLTIPFIFQSYGVNFSRENRLLFQRAVNSFQHGLYSLRRGNLTSSRYGLEWSTTSRSSRFRSISLYLNSLALRILTELTSSTQSSNAILQNGMEELESLGRLWRRRLVQQLVEVAESYVDDGGNVSTSTLIEMRLSLGGDWEVPLCPSDSTCTSPAVARTLSMDRLLEEYRAGDLSFRNEVFLASLWSQSSEADLPELEEILEGILDRLRVIGRSAYLTIDPRSTSPASLEVQAEALRVLLRTGIALTTPLIDRLTVFIASGNTGSSVAFPESPISSVFRMFALAEYDQEVGSVDPNVDLEVSSGELTLLQGSFTSSADPVLTNTTQFEDLGSTPEPLTFQRAGRGEVFLTASLDFIPAELLLFPTYRGLYVERIIRQTDSNEGPTGLPLRVISLASTVVITIQITSPDNLVDVVVQALMPGGLEPIDPLVTESRATTCELERLRVNFAFWYWPVCPRQETRPSEVTFRYSRLRAGTHGIHFRAIAASVGNWILPPVQAYVSSQPEVMGLSTAGEFQVCQNCDPVFVEADEAVMIPVSCPGDCNGSGICDLTSGECRCDDGYTGDDCSTIETT